ncbi:MAG: MFS transporter, partial [Chloroflexi bacterium]|nr:MFS transporter [Chloroflexota bacterium]
SGPAGETDAGAADEPSPAESADVAESTDDAATDEPAEAPDAVDDAADEATLPGDEPTTESAGADSDESA